MIHELNSFADSSANVLTFWAGVSTLCILLTRLESGKNMRSVWAIVVVHPRCIRYWILLNRIHAKSGNCDLLLGVHSLRISLDSICKCDGSRH